MSIYNGNCLELLRMLPDNSVDSIVTDPPYGLSFMGKKWDYDVPSVEIWAECLRVLKPGGHMLAFAGTRTQHRMAVRIEDAGFEIRDMIAWVYGCLSEDSEVLTKDGWVRYHKAIHSEIVAYDVQNDFYQWEKPSRWNEYRVESDTAYRIQSDNTDQIVSRGHRCLVERDGVLTFVSADELTSVEIMPTLHDNFLGLQEAGAEVLHSGMQRSLQGSGLGHTRAQGAISLGGIQPRQLLEENDRREKSSVEGRLNLLQTQRQVCGSVDQIRQVSATAHSDGTQGRLCNGTQTAGGIGDWQTTDSDRVRTSCEPRRNGQPLGKPDAVCNQCRPQALRARTSYNTTVATVTAIEYTGLIWCPTVSTGAFVARRNGKVFITGNSGFPKSLDVSKAIDKAAGASVGWFGPWFRKWREDNNISQKSVSELFPSKTGGLTGCVANWELGLNMPTPEQFNIIKETFGLPFESIYAAEREIIGQDTKARSTSGNSALPTVGGETVYQSWNITAPATPAAQQWQGWGTALKPALEPITVARKPLTGTVANNVLQYGTGAINIDGCRVATDDRLSAGSGGLLSNVRDDKEYPQDNGFEQSPLGRWPANLIHDGSDEVLATFPNAKGQQGVAKNCGGDSNNAVYGKLRNVTTNPEPRDDSGSAARFFYCPKASKADRNYGCSELPDISAADMVDREPDSDGMNSPRAGAGRTSGAKNNHPTVKPIALMRYLCRLVTPPGGVVLDPFTGSGSTGVAATLEGFNFLGAEMDANFHTIASARLNQARIDSGAPTLITIIEYDHTSKPTGRICRLPDTSREQLPDLLTLYGFTGDYSQYTGRMEGYHPMYWCFVYQGSMGHHPGQPAELYELLAP